MRGHVILGVISGLLFGVFVAADLFMLRVTTLSTFNVIGMPIIGLVLGVVLAAWAPIGRGRAAAAGMPTPVSDEASA